MKIWKEWTFNLIVAVLAILAAFVIDCEQPDGGTNGNNNQTPVVDDYTIGNLTQTAGSVTAVTITPKESKSTGKITIYYEGTGGTTYKKSATIPTEVGTYPVTFNVAAADGWNAVSGLFAGILTINEAIQVIQTPAAGDYNVRNLTQTADNITAVTVTPKEGKSSGTITIYYNGLTTLPTTAGTYPVTFNVAASTGWNAVSGLFAGMLTINAAVQVNQTPTAADYNIGNLIQTFGSVTTVTIRPKEGKSTGAVTIYYKGSTTLPTAVGTYAVTFDVAAANGWNAASGLSAGTLTIGNATPSAGDYNFGNLTQTAGNVSAVTITPKEGKSTGAVTIYYNGSTMLPTVEGTYPVTFDVAASTNWNPATGLSAGNMVIGNPNNQTPTSADYNIGNLIQTFGNVTAVTIWPKSGKSSGAVTVEYNNSTTVPSATGTYTVTFNVASASGWNAASGLSAGTLVINPKVIAFAVDSISAQTFTGNEIKPAVTVKDGSTTLTLNTHYNVSYSNNIDIGTATVTVTGVGNYERSTGSGTFTINDNPAIPYVITGSNASFTATRGNAIIGTANQPIQAVIDAVRTHAGGNTRTIQFGNGAALNIGESSASFNNSGGTWGGITLTGKITSSNIVTAVSITSTADITNTAASGGFSTVYFNSTGTFTIAGGKISSTGNNVRTIYNASTGRIIVSGGTVSASGNNSNTIYNASTGSVTVTGGTVENTDSIGYALSNYGIGALTISGGTVSASGGVAVFTSSVGKITVSGTAMITTRMNYATAGTILIGKPSSGDNTDVRFEMTGGTIQNISTRDDSNAICNRSSGEVRITGGKVSALGFAVKNDPGGKVTTTAGATIQGKLPQ